MALEMMLVDPLLVDSDVFPAHHGRRQAWFPAISSLQQKLSESHWDSISGVRLYLLP